MLAPHAVDIAVIISSFIASLCFTFAEPFFSSSSQVVHWSAEIQTKVRKEGVTDRSTKRVNSRSLTKLLLPYNYFWALLYCASFSKGSSFS